MTLRAVRLLAVRDELRRLFKLYPPGTPARMRHIARAAGVTRQHLYKLMKRHGVYE